jgi:peptide/nickel transport system ATP-binding protein
MNAPNAAPILAMVNVTKVYQDYSPLSGRRSSRVVALDRFSLEIRAGEIFGLVGESGSGKTTASRLIIGLETPTEGKIRFQNQDVAGIRGRVRREFSKQAQVIFQDPYQSLNAHLSVYETVCEPLVIHRIGDRSSRRSRVCEALETAGLMPPEAYLQRYPHQLSGGQRQRVAIARAMVLEPRFLIADEPTSMLDASISFQIFQLLNRLRDDFGVAMLFITHSLAAARNLCDRVGVIYRGRLVEMGTARETIMHPRHPYTKALLDAHPRFGSRGHQAHGTLLEDERPLPEGEHCLFYPRCRMALEKKCDLQAPDLKPIDGGHRVACFLFSTTSSISSINSQ